MPITADRSSMKFRLMPLITALLTSCLLIGCATTGPREDQLVYQYQTETRYVRLEPVEANAPMNDHPYEMTTETLRTLLSSLKATGIITLRSDIAVFTDQELQELSGPVVAALAEARPDQDVTFQSRGFRGMFDEHSPHSYTSGRVFVRDGQLNLIIGVLHGYEELTTTVSEPPLFRPGSREARVERDWDLLLPDQGRLVDGRRDWVVLAAPSSSARTAPDASAPTASQPGPSPGVTMESEIEQQSREIESRLRVLDDLKAKGLLSEEEYQRRRQAILDQI